MGGVGLGWIWGILQRPLLILVRRNDPRDLRGLEMGFLGPECLGCGHPASVPTLSRRGLQHREAPETQAWLVLTALGPGFRLVPSAHGEHKSTVCFLQHLGIPFEFCCESSGLGQWHGGGL